MKILAWLALLTGLVLCYVGYQSFVAMRDEMSTINAEVLTFALGVYALLVSAILFIRHPLSAGRLRMPWFTLGFGLPACLCIATAVEYSFIPFPGGDGADPGFWDSKLDAMIDLEGQPFWTFLALLSSLPVVVLFLVWAWPVIAHSAPPRSPNDGYPVAQASDFERTYGWFIEKDGRKIGELEYLRWDSNLQFWHDHQISWYDPTDTVVGPDAWIEAGLVLRSRRHTDVVVESFLTGLQQEPGVISIRGAHVPREKLVSDQDTRGSGKAPSVLMQPTPPASTWKEPFKSAQKSMTPQDLNDIQTKLDSWLPQTYLDFILSDRPQLKSVFYDRDQIIQANLAVRTQCWCGEPLDRFSYVFGKDEMGRLLLLDLDIPGGMVMRQDDSSSDPMRRVKVLSRTFEQWTGSAGAHEWARHIWH